MICLQRSGDLLCENTSARHYCFHTVPSVDYKFPGHTWYAVMIVINLSFEPYRVI